MATQQSSNLLISDLPGKDRAALIVQAVPVTLTVGDILARPNARQQFIWFPDSGLISHHLGVEGQTAMEVAMTGNEGMVGAELAIGDSPAPWQSVVRGRGTALRLQAQDFVVLLSTRPVLARLATRQLAQRIAVIARAAPCARFHSVEQRLARWLLMVGDRVHIERLHLTHEIMAGVLGVQRSAVTIAAATLQARGLISYARGHIHITSRARLKAAACRCHGVAARAKLTRRQK